MDSVGVYGYSLIISRICVDTQISNDLPRTPYFDFWAPEYKLHPKLSVKMENQNNPRYLESVRIKALEQLRYLHGAPSVQMQEIPPDIEVLLEDGDNALEDERNDKDIDVHSPEVAAS